VLGRARLLGSADQGRLWSGARADWFAQGDAFRREREFIERRRINIARRHPPPPPPPPPDRSREIAANRCTRYDDERSFYSGPRALALNVYVQGASHDRVSAPLDGNTGAR